LEHGDVTGRDAGGRAMITLTVDDWLLERLLTCDAGSEDLEDEATLDRAALLMHSRALITQRRISGPANRTLVARCLLDAPCAPNSAGRSS
jgi:hypothetical protein